MEELRPRSHSDSRLVRPPSAKGSRSLENHMELPEILVEDFSDQKLQLKQEFETGSLKIKEDFRRCSDYGFHTNMESYGRPRASTCPDDMFRPTRRRPSTPPPMDIAYSSVPKGVHVNRKRTGGRFSFTHHSLTKVTEDIQDSGKILMEDGLMDGITTHCQNINLSNSVL